MTIDERVARAACEITVNGDARTGAACSLGELLDELGHEPTSGGIAVALNGKVVPRRDWSSTRLADGDSVEVVGAVQGG